MEDNLTMGLDDIAEDITEEKPGLEAVNETQQIKRKPFVLWTVAGIDYKLKLTASSICKLEQKYKRNLSRTSHPEKAQACLFCKNKPCSLPNSAGSLPLCLRLSSGTHIKRIDAARLKCYF